MRVTVCLFGLLYSLFVLGYNIAGDATTGANGVINLAASVLLLAAVVTLVHVKAAFLLALGALIILGRGVMLYGIDGLWISLLMHALIAGLLFRLMERAPRPTQHPVRRDLRADDI